MPPWRFAIVCAAWITFPVFLPGQTVEVTLLPAADTALFEFDPDYNMGGQRDLPAGVLGSMADRSRSRILTRFSVSEALPAGAHIESAELRCLVVRVPPGDGGAWFSLHRVLFPWGEGTQRGDNPGGAPAQDAEATWLHRFHPVSPWSEPGGVLGVDFGEEELARTLVERENEEAVFVLNAAGIADLQSALEQTDTHSGWVLRSSEEGQTRSARRFASREHRTDPPRLHVRYTLSGTPAAPVLEIRKVGITTVELSFLATPGLVYDLERGEGLQGSSWELWRTFGPVETEMILSAEDNADDVVSRFYRLMANPAGP